MEIGEKGGVKAAFKKYLNTTQLVIIIITINTLKHEKDQKDKCILYISFDRETL